MDIQGYRKSTPSRGDSTKKHMGEENTRCTGGESQHSPSTRIRQDGKMWSLSTRSSHVSHEVARESIAAVFGSEHGHFLNLRAPLFMGPSKAPGRIPVCLLQVVLFCKVLMSQIYYLQCIRTTVYFHSTSLCCISLHENVSIGVMDILGNQLRVKDMFHLGSLENTRVVCSIFFLYI